MLLPRPGWASSLLIDQGGTLFRICFGREFVIERLDLASRIGGAAQKTLGRYERNTA